MNKNSQISPLLKQLAIQCEEADKAPLGLKSTYKKIAACSKTVQQLVALGLTVDQSFDGANLLRN